MRELEMHISRTRITVWVVTEFHLVFGHIYKASVYTFKAKKKDKFKKKKQQKLKKLQKIKMSIIGRKRRMSDQFIGDKHVSLLWMMGKQVTNDN